MIISDGMLGLLGVFLGFLLAFGAQVFGEYRRRRMIRCALLDELRTNLYLIPQKRHILSNILANLSSGKVLSGDSVRFVSVVYSGGYSSVVMSLSCLEKGSYHAIYEYFRIIDSVLFEHEGVIVGSLDSASLGDVISLQKVRIESVLKALDVVERLAQSHLVGRPEDVFCLLRDYSFIRSARMG